MTIEIKILTSNSAIPSWLQSIAEFTKGMKPTTETRLLTVKIENKKDC